MSKAKFYDNAIVTDGENVFWGHQRLDDIDAATFKEITNDTFEDKDYIYTIKDFSKRRNDNYPFNKRKKTIKGEQVETGEKVKGILFPLFLTLLFGICGMRIWRL